MCSQFSKYFTSLPQKGHISYLMTLCKTFIQIWSEHVKKKNYENKIKLIWLNLLKKIYYGITEKEGGGKNPPPCQIGLNLILFSILFIYILIQRLVVFSQCFFLRYVQHNFKYHIQNMIHQVIQILHFMLELIF